MTEATPALVIGFGHRYRRDDGVGPYVAEALAARGRDALVHEGDGLGLLQIWAGRERCILVDALAGAEPGEIRRIPGDAEDLRAAGFVHSSHRVGLVEAIEIGRRLGRLPARLEIIGIAGRDFGFGPVLSPEVSRAAETLIAELTAAA